MAASEYRALPHQVREVQRLLGKKTLENEIPGLRRGRLCAKRWIWRSQKRRLRAPSPVRGDTP